MSPLRNSFMLLLLSPSLMAQDFFFKTETYAPELPPALQEKVEQVFELCAASGGDWQIHMETMKSNRPQLDAFINGNEADRRQYYFDLYEEMVQNILKIKETEPERELNPIDCGFEWSESPSYMGHYKNFEQFQLSHYQYSGGAHGLETQTYLVAKPDDTLLSLDEMLLDEKALLALLKKYYFEFMGIENQDAWRQQELCCIHPKEGESEEQAFKRILLDEANFFFDEKALVFSYPPYVAASYSMGHVQLALPYEQLKGIIEDSYLP